MRDENKRNEMMHAHVKMSTEQQAREVATRGADVVKVAHCASHAELLEATFVFVNAFCLSSRYNRLAFITNDAEGRWGLAHTAHSAGHTPS